MFHTSGKEDSFTACAYISMLLLVECFPLELKGIVIMSRKLAGKVRTSTTDSAVCIILLGNATHLHCWDFPLQTFADSTLTMLMLANNIALDILLFSRHQPLLPTLAISYSHC